MVRHFLDLPGARVLPTTGLQLVDQAVGHVVDAAAMGVVHGPAGMGKTYAVESALASRSRVGLWSSFPSRPTMRLVAATLFEQLSGSPAGRASRFVLMDAVIEELSVRRPRRSRQAPGHPGDALGVHRRRLPHPLGRHLARPQRRLDAAPPTRPRTPPPAPCRFLARLTAARYALASWGR